MARVLIRKKGRDLFSVYVKPTRPGEQNAERASVVTLAELEATISTKLDRIKGPRPEPAG